MENEIAELEKTGATEIAGKLREAWKSHATSHDTLKAEHSAATAKLKAVERDLAKYKGDLDAASKGGDERVSKLTKERDDYKTAAEQRAADLESFKLRTKLGAKLGISNELARERALDTFLTHYRPEGAGFDERGDQLQGFDKAIDAFKKAEDFYFRAEDSGHGGSRAGADPKPAPPKAGAKPATADDEVLEWSKKLYPQRHENKGAKA